MAWRSLSSAASTPAAKKSVKSTSIFALLREPLTRWSRSGDRHTHCPVRNAGFVEFGPAGGEAAPRIERHCLHLRVQHNVLVICCARQIDERIKERTTDAF